MKDSTQAMQPHGKPTHFFAQSVTPDAADLPRIKALYEQAFPANERRPFDGMLLDKTGSMEILAFYDGTLFCGFACLIDALDIAHIIYLAMAEDVRGRGYGSLALQCIHQRKAGQRVIVDIERQTDTAANNRQRQQRKQFYLRNGYRETPVRYRWEGEDYEILAFGGTLSPQEFGQFWDALDVSIQGKY